MAIQEFLLLGIILLPSVLLLNIVNAGSVALIPSNITIKPGQEVQFEAVASNFTSIPGLIYMWYVPQGFTELSDCYTPAVYNSTQPKWTFSSNCTVIANSSVSGTYTLTVEVMKESKYSTRDIGEVEQ